MSRQTSSASKDPKRSITTPPIKKEFQKKAYVANTIKTERTKRQFCSKHPNRKAPFKDCTECRTIANFREFANKNGGSFLRREKSPASRQGNSTATPTYFNFFICSRGHPFSRTDYDLMQLRWCPVCEISPLLNDGQCKAERSKDAVYNEAKRRKQQQLLQEAKKELHTKQSLPKNPASNKNNAKIDFETYKHLGLSYEQALTVISIISNKANPHRILQIDSNIFGKDISTERKKEFIKTIRKNFNSLALKVHPDKNPHPRAADAMHIVMESLNKLLLLLQ